MAYQWLPRSEVAGRASKADQAGARPEAAFADAVARAIRASLEGTMRWVVRVFAAIGLLATIGALLVGLSFTGIGFSRSSHDHIFNWGGLDPRQHYTVVWDDSEASPRDGPFEVICFQLEGGGFAPSDPKEWSWQANDAWEAKVRNDALPGESALGCIPDSEIKSNSTGMLLWRMEYFGRNARGATAIFYHRPTMRLLFVNWAT